jgi:hypothetical protein
MWVLSRKFWSSTMGRQVEPIVFWYTCMCVCQDGWEKVQQSSWINIWVEIVRLHGCQQYKATVKFLGYTYPCAQHCQHKGWKSYNPSFTHKPETYPCAQHCQHKDGNPIIHHLPINPIHTHVHNIANTRMAIL